MFVVKWITDLIKTLNSNQNPGEIAAGIAFAFMLALIPSNNLLWILLFILTFFLKVHFGIEALFLVLFKLFMFLFDPLLDSFGYMVLTIPALKNTYTGLINTPFMPFTKFNNTIVMGGFALGIILWLPIFILFTVTVKFYRNKLKSVIENSKLVKGFLNAPFISLITKIISKASSITFPTH